MTMTDTDVDYYSAPAEIVEEPAPDGPAHGLPVPPRYTGDACWRDVREAFERLIAESNLRWTRATGKHSTDRARMRTVGIRGERDITYVSVGAWDDASAAEIRSWYERLTQAGWEFTRVYVNEITGSAMWTLRHPGYDDWFAEIRRLDGIRQAEQAARVERARAAAEILDVAIKERLGESARWTKGSVSCTGSLRYSLTGSQLAALLSVDLGDISEFD